MTHFLSSLEIIFKYIGPFHSDLANRELSIKSISFSHAVRRGDVLSAWSGIRPLVIDPSKSDTQSIARNHVIEVSPSRLITIAGKAIIITLSFQ